MIKKRLRRMRSNDTVQKSAWGVVEQVVGLVAALLTATLLARTIGPDAYGAYAGVYALMVPFLAFTNGGLGLAVLDQIIREQKPAEQVMRSYIGAVWTIGPFVALAVTVLAARFIHNISVMAAAFLTFGEVMIGSTMSATNNTIQSVRGFAYSSRVRTFVMANKVVVLLVLSLAGKLSVNTLAAVQTITFLLVGLAIGKWQYGLTGAKFGASRFTGRDLKDAGVYAVGIGASGVQNSYDQTVLSGSHVGDAGRYAAAYRIASLGLVPLAAVANATHNDFLDPDAGLADQMHKARRFAVIGAVYSVIFGVCAYFLVPLVPKILGAKYEDSVGIMRWLIPLVPLRGLSIFPLNGLLGLGRVGLRTRLLVTGAIISLVLYFSLIPAYSWKGAVAGTLISEALLFVAAWLALFRAQHQARVAIEAGRQQHAATVS